MKTGFERKFKCFGTARHCVGDFKATGTDIRTIKTSTRWRDTTNVSLLVLLAILYSQLFYCVVKGLGQGQEFKISSWVFL